ncbi:MAG: acetate--CoA ligase [Gammaproteobacteria bacterium]|nr:acetate--CoA ligase [Gammaproteobacteria bacterium]
MLKCRFIFCLRITMLRYAIDYPKSLNQTAEFWAEQAKQYVNWFKPWHTVTSGNFGSGNVRWFDGGELNVSYNCLDRHLETRGEQVALLWEGDEPTQSKRYTYRQLYTEVCQFSNVLKKLHVKKGDRVCIYMPMIVEAVVAMLACARIGAVHSVVFAGFSPESLKDRVIDARAKLIITADEGMRAGKTVPLKQNVEKCLKQCPDVEHVIVVKHTGNSVPIDTDRDIWYHDAMQAVDSDCLPETMQAEDPLFILYTSGSTGKPKGVLHTTGGYLVYVAMTYKLIFDYQDGDVYWCTADVGWITGHSYLVYGPLCNGAISLMFEGTPMYPTPARFWQVIDKYQVNIFYTAPTAIRALMREGDRFVKDSSRTSLKLLASVGEPINPEVWQWYADVVGDGRCPVIDTWWQTETGGIMIAPIPYQWPLKPGSASKPFYGINAALVTEKGKLLEGTANGQLVISQPWPGMMRTIYGDHDRYLKTYFKPYPGFYFTGDGARRDDDSYYWITGRTDDVLNVSGHRLGTAEIESAIVLHENIAEAAVVGYPHDIKGQGIYAYVTPMAGIKPSEQLRKETIALVRAQIGPIASIDKLQWCTDLPKTRSGKIMRRILRKIAANELDQLGDTSTLANPEIVQQIISERVK